MWPFRTVQGGIDQQEVENMEWEWSPFLSHICKGLLLETRTNKSIYY